MVQKKLQDGLQDRSQSPEDWGGRFITVGTERVDTGGVTTPFPYNRISSRRGQSRRNRESVRV